MSGESVTVARTVRLRTFLAVASEREPPTMKAAKAEDELNLRARSAVD